MLLWTAAVYTHAQSGGGPPFPEGEARDFIFERFNQTYRDLSPEISEIQKDPLVIHLSAPKHEMILRSHRLTAVPIGKERHRLRLEIVFEGSGILHADIQLMGMKTRLSDRFWMPPQEKIVEGEFLVKRVAAGYQLTSKKIPQAIKVRIRTDLGNRLVNWCDSMAWISSALIDCQDLDRALSRPTLPLDAAATAFVADADLLLEERAALDQYLRQTAFR